MKLSEIRQKDIKLQQIILVGDPVETNIMTSGANDTVVEPYFEVQLKNPVKVRCSVDAGIEFETQTVHVRKSALESDGWAAEEGEFENEEERGYFMPNWLIDWSKGQEIVIYQETTIQRYFQNNRKGEADTKRKGMMDRIKKRQEEAAAAKKSAE